MGASNAFARWKVDGCLRNRLHFGRCGDRRQSADIVEKVSVGLM